MDEDDGRVSRVQFLGPKQAARPSWCQVCGDHFFQSLADTVILKWIVDANGRVLWYLYSCKACFAPMPRWSKALAIEPPRERERDEPVWDRTRPVEAPPDRYRRHPVRTTRVPTIGRISA